MTYETLKDIVLKSLFGVLFIVAVSFCTWVGAQVTYLQTVVVSRAELIGLVKTTSPYMVDRTYILAELQRTDRHKDVVETALERNSTTIESLQKEITTVRTILEEIRAKNAERE